MAFAFVHTADWQIGKVFAAFPQDVAAALGDARLKAIERIAALAHQSGVRDILVAGDIYDSDGVSDRSLRQPLEIIKQHPKLIWHLLPGNHDHIRAGGIWDRVLRFGLPDNARLYQAQETHEIANDVMLLPAPLHGRTASEDPTAWMSNAPTSEGMMRLGLAHGSIGRFGSDGHASVPIAPDRAGQSGLTYLALGDDHGLKKINERAWYSGTPEPDGWRQNEPGHVLVVRLKGPTALPAVEAERTAAFKWAEIEIPIDTDGALLGLQDQLQLLGPSPRDCLVRLTLKGAISLEAEQHTEQELDRISAQVRHLETDKQGLRLEARLEDIGVLGKGTELHKVGLRLLASTGSPAGSDTDRIHARLALSELLAFSNAYNVP